MPKSYTEKYTDILGRVKEVKHEEITFLLHLEKIYGQLERVYITVSVSNKVYLSLNSAYFFLLWSYPSVLLCAFSLH